MISLKELLHGNQESDFTPEIMENAHFLLIRVNVIRKEWNKPMVVTSGLRTQADQARINPKATKSNHLTGHAIDILDEGLHLTRWLKTEGADLAACLGLYFELGNKDWVHMQDVPPKSGNRWFLP